MLSALLAGALIAAASLLLGAAVMVLAGRPRHSPVGPAAGLSVLLVVCGIAIKLPGHGTAAAVAAGLALIAAAVVLQRGREPLGSVSAGAVVAVLGTALVIAIPFATSGRVGILGQGLINDDMASHLLFTEWADTHEGPTPDLIQDGYPLGPHAIVSATSKVVPGADLIETFAGLTGAIAVLAALTAYGALAGVRERFRGPAAVLAALPYLGAAYLAQGAFKEPMLGLALVGFALSPARAEQELERVAADLRLHRRGPRPRLDEGAGTARDPGRCDRRGHHLQLQLPRARLARDRAGRMGADRRLAREGRGGGAEGAPAVALGPPGADRRLRDPGDRRAARRSSTWSSSPASRPSTPRPRAAGSGSAICASR